MKTITIKSRASPLSPPGVQRELPERRSRRSHRRRPSPTCPPASPPRGPGSSSGLQSDEAPAITGPNEYLNKWMDR